MTSSMASPGSSSRYANSLSLPTCIAIESKTVAAADDEEDNDEEENDDDEEKVE